jgi:molybdate transport system regulatory protein
MKSEAAIELHGAVWMTVGGENFGGLGRIALLAAIASCGSITRAAKEIHMSYKAAWDAVDQMNNLAGEALVERVSGGKGGGGTRLTARGAQLVENFRTLERAHQRFIEQLGQQPGGLSDDFLMIRRMHMKTSARNQFLGTVAHVKAGAVNDEITLDISGGQRLVAMITHESTRELGLAPGVQAFALVKDASIILVTDEQGARFSARNRLGGTIARIDTGAVNTQVVLDLGGGATLAAIITNDSCAQLALAVGEHATGIFKASSIILAIPS